MGSEGEAVAALVPAFERSHPGIRVRTQPIPWSAAHEKLLTAYVGESMPDVFQLGNTWIPEMVTLGAVTPLTERIEASSSIRKDDYFAGIYATNVIEGTTYAVPWYVDTRLLFYRSDLLSRAGRTTPPATWNEWRDVMQRLKRSGEGDESFAILLPIGEWEPPVIFAMELGAELLRDGNRYGNFRSPEFRRGFEFYLDLFRDALAPSGAAAHSSDPYRDFAAGFFCFYITGPWNLGEFARRLPQNLQNSWTTAPMPGPQDRAPGLSLAGGASLAMFRGSKHPDEAWELIEFLSEPAQQLALYHATGDLPSRMSAWTTAGLEKDPRARAFWLQLGNVRPTPQVPEWERIAARIGQHAETAIRGLVEVDEMLTALDADADIILAKRRSLLAARRGEITMPDPDPNAPSAEVR